MPRAINAASMRPAASPNSTSRKLVCEGETLRPRSRNAAANNRLSLSRAQAVVDYLVQQWEFPRERFKIVGNGSERPLCNESAPEAEGLSLDACREANRSTRIAVFGARQ